MADFLDGIKRYRDHPYCRIRALGDAMPATIWQDGSSRLLDYGTGEDKDGEKIVLFVPSLINCGYILGLTRDRSLMRYLATSGLRPMLLEWGAPAGKERDFGLEDYICGRLDGALDAALDATGRPIALAGYCMGGMLAMPAALARPADIFELVLMATP